MAETLTAGSYVDTSGFDAGMAHVSGTIRQVGATMAAFGAQTAATGAAIIAPLFAAKSAFMSVANDIGNKRIEAVFNLSFKANKAEGAQLRVLLNSLGSVASDKLVKLAGKTRDSLSIMQESIRILLAEIGSMLAPILQEAALWVLAITKRIRAWVDANQPLIKQIATIGVVLVGVGSSFVAMATAIYFAGSAVAFIARNLATLSTIVKVLSVGSLIAGFVALVAMLSSVAAWVAPAAVGFAALTATMWVLSKAMAFVGMLLVPIIHAFSALYTLAAVLVSIIALPFQLLAAAVRYAVVAIAPLALGLQLVAFAVLAVTKFFVLFTQALVLGMLAVSLTLKAIWFLINNISDAFAFAKKVVMGLWSVAIFVGSAFTVLAQGMATTINMIKIIGVTASSILFGVIGAINIALGAVVLVVTGAMALITTLITALASFIVTFLLLPIAGFILSFVVGPIIAAFAFVAGAIIKLADLIAQAFAKLAGKIAGAFVYGAKAGTSILSKVLDFFSRLFGSFKTGLKEAAAEAAKHKAELAKAPVGVHGGGAMADEFRDMGDAVLVTTKRVDDLADATDGVADASAGAMGGMEKMMGTMTTAMDVVMGHMETAGVFLSSFLDKTFGRTLRFLQGGEWGKAWEAASLQMQVWFGTAWSFIMDSWAELKPVVISGITEIIKAIQPIVAAVIKFVSDMIAEVYKLVDYAKSLPFVGEKIKAAEVKTGAAKKMAEITFDSALTPEEKNAELGKLRQEFVSKTIASEGPGKLSARLKELEDAVAMQIVAMTGDKAGGSKTARAADDFFNATIERLTAAEEKAKADADERGKAVDVEIIAKEKRLAELGMESDKLAAFSFNSILEGIFGKGFSLKSMMPDIKGMLAGFGPDAKMRKELDEATELMAGMRGGKGDESIKGIAAMGTFSAVEAGIMGGGGNPVVKELKAGHKLTKDVVKAVERLPAKMAFSVFGE